MYVKNQFDAVAEQNPIFNKWVLFVHTRLVATFESVPKFDKKKVLIQSVIINNKFLRQLKLLKK